MCAADAVCNVAAAAAMEVPRKRRSKQNDGAKYSIIGNLPIYIYTYVLYENMPAYITYLYNIYYHFIYSGASGGYYYIVMYIYRYYIYICTCKTGARQRLAAGRCSVL